MRVFVGASYAIFSIGNGQNSVVASAPDWRYWNQNSPSLLSLWVVQICSVLIGANGSMLLTI